MKLRRILCFVIALAMIVLLCASCNGNNEKNDPDREGQIIVATWNKGNIWSGDIYEWVNYFYSRYYTTIQKGEMTTDDVIKLGINAYCLVPLLEDYLKGLGEVVSEETIELSAISTIMSIDEEYSEEYDAIEEIEPNNSENEISDYQFTMQNEDENALTDIRQEKASKAANVTTRI